MKKTTKIILNFLAFGILIIATINFFSYAYVQSNLLKITLNSIKEDAEMKSKEINFYVSRMNEDMKVLQLSENVKELFKKNRSLSEETIEINQKTISRVIVKEIENYLRSRPEKTLKDLQGEEYFRKIAIQLVTKNRSCFLFDTQKGIIYFSDDSQFQQDYFSIKESSQELGKLFQENLKDGSSEGFYVEDEGIKYAKFTQIPFPTADGINLSFGVNFPLTEYQPTLEKSEFIDSIKDEVNYNNIILISSEGDIIYMSELGEGIGTNLEWDINLEKGLYQHYLITRENENDSFYGPFVETYGNLYPEFSILSPIYDGGKILGYAGIIESMEDIFEITGGINELGAAGESYLVNYGGILISPLKKNILNILVQSVDVNTSECLGSFPSLEEDNSEEFIFNSYNNYEGEKVFGLKYPIYGVNWCLISEVKKQESIDSQMYKTTITNLYVSVALIFLFLVLSIPLHNLFQHLKKKFKNKLPLIKKIFSYGFFGILFISIFIYIFYIPKTLGHIGLILDVLSLIVFTLLFFYVINKKPSSNRRKVLFGISLCILSEIMQVTIEGRFFESSFSSILWAVISTIGLIGIFLIFLGFKEGMK